MRQLVFGVVLSVTVSAQSNLAETGPPPITGRIAFELAAEPAECLPRAPIRVRVQAHNTTDERVFTHIWMGPWSGRLDLLWRGPGADFRPYNFHDIRKGVDENGVKWTANVAAGRRMWVEGGSVLRKYFIVGFDETLDAFIFTQPGEYQFKVRYRNGDSADAEVLESNVVTVTVTSVPDGDRASFEAYTRDMVDVAQFPTTRTLRSRQALAAGEYLEKFPLSPYAPLLQDGLVQYLHKEHRTPEEEILFQRYGNRRPAYPY